MNSKVKTYILFATIAFILFVSCFRYYLSADQFSNFVETAEGLSSDEVTLKLGKPRYVIKKSDTTKQNEAVSDETFIVNSSKTSYDKVLVYEKGLRRAYVYVESNVVVHTLLVDR